MNWSRFFLTLTLTLALSPTLRADPPVASFIYPAGGQVGATVKAHVGGLHLYESCDLELVGDGVKAPSRIHRTTSPWFEGYILPLRESQRQEDYPRAMAAEFAIAAKAQPGFRQVFLRTSQGITEPLKFVVGTFPEVMEAENSGRPNHVTLPVTANGRIFPQGSTDEWEVSLKKDQTLTCAAVADRIGSPLLPGLEILAADGRVLAESDSTLSPDPVLSFKAPADGMYRVRIRDTGLKGGAAYVYRLTLTTGPWIESVFPLGGRRGETLKLDRFGSVAIPKDAADTFAFPPAPGSNVVWLDVDDLPEVAEGSPLAVPGIANGRIAKPAEADAWDVTATKGQKLSFELRAARLGSPLLGTITISDTTGKVLAKVEPGSTTGRPGKTDPGFNPLAVDPTLDFIAPADGTYRVEVRDLFRSRGGERFAYRLRVREQTAPFALTLTEPTLTISRGAKSTGKGGLKIAITRSANFKDPIELKVEGLPRGVTAPDTISVKPNQPQFDLPLSAAEDAVVTNSIVRVIGTAPGLPPVEAMFPTGPGEAKFEGLRLAVAVPTPFRIYGEFTTLLHPRGSRLVKTFHIERNGYEGPLEVTLAEKQARHLQGVTGPTITVPAGANDFTYEIDLPPWMEIGRTSRTCVLGTGRVKDADGTEHVVSYSSTAQNDQMIAVVEPGRLGLQLDVPSVPVTPDGERTLAVSIQRAKDLTGAAKISAVVPANVTGVSATPITIAADGADGELKLRFAREVRGPSSLAVTIRAVIATPDGPVTAEETIALVPLDKR